MKTNPVVNMHDLSLLLSSKLDLSETSTINALKEVFDVVSEHALTEEGVEIDALGKFNVEHIECDTKDAKSLYKLAFNPNTSFTNVVNKPFVNFEPTELSKDVEFEGVEVIEQKSEHSFDIENDQSILYIQKAEEVQEELVVETNNEPEPLQEMLTDEESIAPDVDIDISESDEVVFISPPDPEPYQENDKDDTSKLRDNKKRRSALALAVAVGVVVVITASAFFFQTKTYS